VSVAIIGGGIMGISLGYFLSRQGIKVEIFETSSVLGGLAGPLTLSDGTKVDRFYHAILSSDSHLGQLCAELGLSDQLRFRETKMGFYYKGKIYSMNNVVEFLRFPPLGWIDRFRLGLTVLYAQFIKDWHKLEGITVEDWLLRLSGRRTFDNIWRPMLKAKFDGTFANTPATYMWARLVRTRSTRGGANQKEEAGHLIGGYEALIKAMAERIEAAGGKVHLNTPVHEVVIEQGRAKGIRLGDEVYPFSAVAVTMQTPIFKRLIPNASPDYLGFLGKTEYLGIVCPLLVLDRPLTGYWTLNITDDQVPFTGVIETTTYIDTHYTGGNHLIYLPKYTAPGSNWQQIGDNEIQTIWLDNLEKMFPSFKREQVRYFLVHRERYVEPLHGLNSANLIPGIKTPIENLYLATTAQIYPALTNGESVSRHAHEAAQIMLKNDSVSSYALASSARKIATAENAL
jgi:protoporphyrinogen oxidase